MFSGNSRLRTAALILAVCSLVNLSHIGQSQEPASPRPASVAKPPANPVEADPDKLLSRLRLDLEKPIDFESLSAKEIESEIALRGRGRKVALQRRIEAMMAEYDAGISGVTVNSVLAAHAELADFELESAATAAERVRAIRTVVEASRQIEARVVRLQEFGAMGGSFKDAMEAMAVRLKWEQQLAKEALAMKRLERDK